jgi:hypothetical protein
MGIEAHLAQALEPARALADMDQVNYPAFVVVNQDLWVHVRARHMEWLQ